MICPACGAKLRSSRTCCLRCGESLEASSGPSRASRFLGRLPIKPGPVIVGSVLCSLALPIVVAISIRSGNRAAPAAAAPAATPRPVAVAPRPHAPASREPQFLDPKHGGTVAYAQGEYRTALDRYRQAIERDPHDADALNNLGQVLTRTGNPTEAIPYLEHAIQLYPTVWSYRFNLAHAYGQSADWAHAVTEYRAAQALFPDDYVTEFNLAMALHQQGREEEAVAGYQKAIVLAPGEASFHLSLGVSYETLNRRNDAVESYRRYLALAPEAPDAQQVTARIQALTDPVTAEGNPPPPAAKG